MKTITFYSYKGGTGRSMLVAAAAKFLAEYGKKVFLLDFDIEAPGLHHKFGKSNKDIQFDLVSFLKESATVIDRNPGRIEEKELFGLFASKFKALEISSNNQVASIWLLPAGRAPEIEYIDNLLKINWSGLFSRNNDTVGHLLFKVLVLLIKNNYAPDYILVDSRTGITDIGGMALNFMADKLVLLYINNIENLHGIKTLINLLDLERVKNQLFLINSRVPPSKVLDQKKLLAISSTGASSDECRNLHHTLKNQLIPNGAKFFTLHNESLLQLVERITYDPNFTPRDSALNIDNLKFFQSIFPDEFNESPFKCIFPPLAGDKVINGECIDIQRIIENNYNEESKLPLTDILDRIKKRHKSGVEKKENNSDRVICNYLPPKYIDDDIYIEFVKNIRQSIVEMFNPKHDDLIRPIEKMPIEFKKSGLTFYNYDVLGIQMNAGLFDFSEEIYFKTETRSALLSVIKLAELKSYCIVANAKHKDQIIGLHTEFTKTDPHEIHFIETLYDKGFNQFGLIASHAAAGECTKTIEKIGCPQNIVLKNTEDELKQWLLTDETIMRKIAFCDHKIGKNIANKDENIFCSTEMIDLNYDPPIDVGLIYPSGDISWRQVIVKAITEVIKNDPEIWQSTDQGKTTVFKIFEEEYLHPLTLKELAENLLLDIPLSEGTEWIKKVQPHFIRENSD